MEIELRALLLPVVPRVYWSRAPQSPAPARPYVVLHRVSATHDYHFKGASGAVDSRVQIDVVADTYASARATADAITTALSGYRGGNFQAIFIDNERALPLEAGDTDELYRIVIDVLVHYATPA